MNFVLHSGAALLVGGVGFLLLALLFGNSFEFVLVMLLLDLVDFATRAPARLLLLNKVGALFFRLLETYLGEFVLQALLLLLDLLLCLRLDTLRRLTKVDVARFVRLISTKNR